MKNKTKTKQKMMSKKITGMDINKTKEREGGFKNEILKKEVEGHSTISFSIY